MSQYDPRAYWSAVATQVGERERGGTLLAGDDTPFYRYKRAAFSRRLLSRVPVEGSSVLEVGCGPGANLLELAGRRPRRLVGCDISAAMLELAASQTAATGAELVEVDGRSLPFADREFDVAYTVTVLHHNTDDYLGPLLREICRVSANGVYLFEHTALVRGESLAYVERPVADYERVCAGEGFSLVETRQLRVAASEAVSTRLRRRLNRSGRDEGDSVSALNVAVETAVLPMTRLLDRARPQRRGLTLMAFARETPAQRADPA